MSGKRPSQALRFLLHGEDNQTLEGTLILDNPHFLSEDKEGFTEATNTDVWANYDQAGASIYATVVIAVYGFSIVLLIGSHIFLKKKENKRDGDEQQIDKYLAQVPSLKEKSKRDSFRKLKRSIIPLVNMSMAADITHLSHDAQSHKHRHRKHSLASNESLHSGPHSGRASPIDLTKPLLLEPMGSSPRKEMVHLVPHDTDDDDVTINVPTMPIIFEDDIEYKQSPDKEKLSALLSKSAKCGQSQPEHIINNMDDNPCENTDIFCDNEDRVSQLDSLAEQDQDVGLDVTDVIQEEVWVIRETNKSRTPSPVRPAKASTKPNHDRHKHESKPNRFPLSPNHNGTKHHRRERSRSPKPNRSPTERRSRSPRMQLTPPGSPRWMGDVQSPLTLRGNTPHEESSEQGDGSNPARQVTSV